MNSWTIIKREFIANSGTKAGGPLHMAALVRAHVLFLHLLENLTDWEAGVNAMNQDAELRTTLVPWAGEENHENITKLMKKETV